MDANEQSRVRALDRLDLLDSPVEERFDRVVRLTQRLFDMPTVAVNLVGRDRLFVKSAVGLLDAGTSHDRSVAICPRAVESGETVLIPDLRLDAVFGESALVTDDPGLRFYAGEPLAAPGGELVGALCLMDQRPRELSTADQQLLRDLAAWIEYELAADADAVQAMEIQRRLMPRRPPSMTGYDVAGGCQPALRVGGDYYDWLPVGDTVQFVVADVMGKGLSAAVIAAGVRTALRVTSRFNPLAEAVRRTASSMQEDFDETATFATLFTARVTTADGSVEYVDAGHGLALVIPAVGPTRRLASHDLPLGVLPDGTFELHHAHLDPGDTLIVVSDGILDVFADPLAAVAAAEALTSDATTAQEMVDRIISVGAGRPLDDDLTAVVVRRERSGEPHPDSDPAPQQEPTP